MKAEGVDGCCELMCIKKDEKLRNQAVASRDGRDKQTGAALLQPASLACSRAWNRSANQTGAQSGSLSEPVSS